MMHFRYLFLLTFFNSVHIVTSSNIRIDNASASMNNKQRYIELPAYRSKPNVAVLTDISNEPDDQESLTRLLLYSNQLNIRALIATTSTWLQNTTSQDSIQHVINVYSGIVDNLNVHVPLSQQYPAAQYLTTVVASGVTGYGISGAVSQPLSNGTLLLLSIFSNLDIDETLYIPLWGGANTLAQALLHLRSVNTTFLSNLIPKLRVHSISDQDDAGPYLRLHFPTLRWVSSLHAWKTYGLATWTGFSGDVGNYYKFDGGGPDVSLVTASWIKEHVQIGAYGANTYPNFEFVPEGDSPSFFGLIQNGLNIPEKPEWGGWGGRYSLLGEDSGMSNTYSDTADRVVGIDRIEYVSNHATIWRWREAIQWDFAARMQ